MVLHLNAQGEWVTAQWRVGSWCVQGIRIAGRGKARVSWLVGIGECGGRGGVMESYSSYSSAG